MSESTVSVAGIVLRRARVAALEEAGWTFVELSDGWIAELGEHRGVFGTTVEDVLKRIEQREHGGRS